MLSEIKEGVIEHPSSDHPNCMACGLFKNCETPFVSADTIPDAEVLFIGEAPGRSEDEEGKPFVGVSGKLLRQATDSFDIVSSYTNAVRCRPRNNERPSVKQIKMCRPFVFEDIRETDAPVIGLLGNTALRSVLDETGITGWRGNVISRDGKNYAAALHPAAIMPGRGSKAEQKEWLNDIYEMGEIAQNGLPEPMDSHYEYLFVDAPEKARQMLRELKQAEKCAFDMEFVTIEVYVPGNKLIMASFATGSKAWALPLYHSEFEWDEDDYIQILEVMDDFAQDDDIHKIGHNIKIDYLMLKAYTGVDLQGIVGDTMLLSQILDSRAGKHGLKHMANQRLNMHNFDAGLNSYVNDHPEADPKQGGSYAFVPLETLWPYAAKDAAATYMLESILLEEANRDQVALYRELLVPCIGAFTRMELAGCLPDLDIVEEYTKVYEDRSAVLLRKMRAHSTVKKFEEDSNVEVNAKLHDLNHELDRLISSGEGGQEKLERKIAVQKKRLKIFNPNSSVQLAKVLYDYMGHKVHGETLKGNPSVAADVIQWLEGAWIEVYREWKLYHSALTKYLYTFPTWVRTDGRIRSSYNIVGTVTGRTSSKEPNLQNIPNPFKRPGTLLESHPIKNGFRNTWDGGCLYAVDYGAIEMRVMASLSQSLAMINMFNRGDDAHTFVASKLYKIPEEKVTKIQRSDAKTVNWTMIFRGGWNTLVRTYKLPVNEAKELEVGWYSIFPEVLEYIEDEIDLTRHRGYSLSPFGRRRFHPTIDSDNESQIKRAEREAANMAIQSTANELTLMSLVISEDIVRLHGMKTRLINTVHDSLVFDVYPGELEEIDSLVTDVMVNLPDYAEEYFPSLSFNWLRVPLVVDSEVGTHYGALEHYEREI